MLPFHYGVRDIPVQSRIANLSRLGVWLFQRTIRQGLSHSHLCVFPERWIADEAERYHVDSLNTQVIPFGANIEDPSDEAPAHRSFSTVLEKGRIDLLFIGKDWTRKGGDIAVETTQILRSDGFDAVLHVVGGKPDYPVPGEYVKLYGYLDKTDGYDLQQLDTLFRESDVFIFPSVSEGSVIAVVEAAAYGLPTLAYDVAGVNGRVVNKKSGLLFPVGSPAECFVAAIAAWFADPDSYDRLVQGARTHYETSSNWTVAVKQLFSHISCQGLA
jgi:glycosyltransferase involved in cell wall biosynthesis